MSTDSPTTKRERQKARRAARLEEEAKQAQRSNYQRMLFTGIAVVAGIALVVGIGYLLVQGSDATLGVETATVVEGTPLAPPPAGGVDPAIGAQAPVVEGSTPDGDSITLGGEGQAQAVVFMAHWCPHCQAEAPLIADWVDEGLLPDDVQLVAVSTRHDPARPNWPPDEWLEGEDFPGPILIDGDDTVAEAWGLSGTPMWTFTDDTGAVVQRYSGQIDAERFEQGAALAAGEEVPS